MRILISLILALSACGSDSDSAPDPQCQAFCDAVAACGAQEAALSADGQARVRGDYCLELCQTLGHMDPCYALYRIPWRRPLGQR